MHSLKGKYSRHTWHGGVEYVYGLRLWLKILSLSLSPSLQIMSLEDVEKIMDETQEAIEYQRVSQAVIT